MNEHFIEIPNEIMLMSLICVLSEMVVQPEWGFGHFNLRPQRMKYIDGAICACLIEVNDR